MSFNKEINTSYSLRSSVDPGVAACSTIPAIFLLAVILTIWRFGPWMPTVFFGDDLSNFLAYKDGLFPRGAYEALLISFADKYRPVFVWALTALFGVFDENIASYLAVNVLLQGLNATLVFVIARRLSRGSFIASFVIALLTATSRFALYQVTQVTGLLEGIALMFFLAMIYCIVRASSESGKPTWNWYWAALIAAFFAIHTHERYIVVVVWLCCTLILVPSLRGLSKFRWIVLMGVTGTIFLFNLLYKTIVLHMPFFVGTGGTHMNFDMTRVLKHTGQAALSVLGFNEGPSYLTGARIAALHWFPAWPLAAMFAFICLSFIFAAMRAVAAERKTNLEVETFPWRWPLLLLALASLLLLPPILTIRVEQRWLFEPFILLLFLFSWAIGVWVNRSRMRVWVASLILGITAVAGDSLIERHFGEIFFVSSGQFATLAKKDIVGANPGQSTPVALLANQDHCNWTLLKGEFFRLYGGNSRTISCFGSLEAMQKIEISKNTRIYKHNVSPPNLEDITTDFMASNPLHERIKTDFLLKFPEGRINDTKKIDTPTGSGAIILPLDSVLGLRNSLVVISGFSYQYDGLAIDQTDTLKFGVSMVYPSRYSARVIVRFDEKGRAPRILFLQDLEPPRTNEKLKFQTVIIPLAEFAGRNVSITFGAETLQGRDSAGHWVAFASPRIVGRVER